MAVTRRGGRVGVRASLLSEWLRGRGRQPINIRLSVMAVTQRGYKPTGCSCGNACGSWDIRNDQTCHCQCANQDWTAARCCNIAVK
ncbi:UNVERIFIED_CONTAM: hypothetical protein FKN15_057376 [Acipenser sinensis]